MLLVLLTDWSDEPTPLESLPEKIHVVFLRHEQVWILHGVGRSALNAHITKGQYPETT